MSKRRFLGGGWASVHGPTPLRDLLLWTLDTGCDGVSVGPGPRAVNWEGLAAAGSDLPVEIPCVRADSVLEAVGCREGSLASTDGSERNKGVQRLNAAVALARVVGCPHVVLQPGVARVPGETPGVDLGDRETNWDREAALVQLARRDAVLNGALDALCRSLWEATRRSPDIEFCLTASRHAYGLGEPRALAHVFDDLARRKVAYWHDAPLAARREEVFGTAQGEWLEMFGNRMSGITLGDSVGPDLYLPPGSGGVDYALLSSYRRRTGQPIPLVLDLDPAVLPAEIPGVHSFLTKYGL